ncbi:helix-turn-helix domain-containing protein [Caballeronia terrestris]|uniref:helix-turn-helix domain-containing protein n=1 Tax=Caballeronia terrestris TaxID=1226301 RepID=UPI002E0EAF22
MMGQLTMLRAFVAAADRRSFNKAAASLGGTTGSICEAISKLGASLDACCIERRDPSR